MPKGKETSHSFSKMTISISSQVRDEKVGNSSNTIVMAIIYRMKQDLRSGGYHAAKRKLLYGEVVQPIPSCRLRINIIQFITIPLTKTPTKHPLPLFPLRSPPSKNLHINPSKASPQHQKFSKHPAESKSYISSGTPYGRL